MSQPPQQRFVPSGVNAQSWLGFEQRIQERRFRALLETINTAIAQGDAAGARVAFDEARELRPGAAELADIDARIAALAPHVPVTDSRAAWSRPLGAVMMLLVGICLLIGIDWLRGDDRPMPSATPVAASPDFRVATPVPAATADEPAVTIVPPPAAEDLATPAPGQEIGTSGVEIRAVLTPSPLRPAMAALASPRAVRSPVAPRGEIPDDFVAVAPMPAPRATGTGVTVPGGEIPDDFVFVPQTSARPAPAPAARPSQGPARPSLAAGTSAAVAPPAPAAQRDETRVAAVLNEYARAYGQLDASAARQVWPSVDQRALARAFENLSSQSVSFDDCAIDVQGVTANASCRGTASYVGRVGSGETRVEPRTWRFELRRDGEAWKIENAEARRQ